MSDLKTRLLDRIKKHFTNVDVRLVFEEFVTTSIDHTVGNGAVWQESISSTTIRIGVDNLSIWIVEILLVRNAGESERIFKISFPVVSDYDFIFTQESALDSHALTLLDAVLTSDKGQELAVTR